VCGGGADGGGGGGGAGSAELRLVCAESLTARRATLTACPGGGDRRVLRQLLRVDDRYVVASNPYVDADVSLRMRTQLADWIYEVANTGR